MGRQSLVAAISIAAAVSFAPLSAAAIVVTAGPNLGMDPEGVTPLAGIVELATDVPTRATFNVGDTTGVWTVEFPEFVTEHSHPLVGLGPESDYNVEVVLTDELGESLTLEPLEASTGPLPADFPAIEVFVSDPARMEPGFTLLDRFSRGRGNPGAVYSMIVDQAGNVVWYSQLGASDMRHLPNGNLQYMEDSEVVEIDLLGREQSRVVLRDEGTGLHHDLTPTEDGNWLSLSTQTFVQEGYPTSETDPNAPTQTVEVEDNPVAEFTPEGILVNYWPLRDLIDPTRIGYDSLAEAPDGLDWVHANAVLHDPIDDSIIVSVRHQDAVIKFSRQTGELIWILGTHANWGPAFQPYLLQPVGAPFHWQYHEHAPMLTGAGTLLMFDNGNHRASPFDGTVPDEIQDSHSRAVEFAIDEANMTVRQVWEYGDNAEQTLYARAVSDADEMPITGNVLINFGLNQFTDGVFSGDEGLGSAHARIIEVTRETPAEKVFDMRVYDAVTGFNTLIYRAERIPSLYPYPGSDGIGITPLDELGDAGYGDAPSGLYPDSVNMRPPEHDELGLLQATQVLPRDSDGQPDPTNGRIVLLALGGSQTFEEFSAFMRLEAKDAERNPAVVLVNGAQSDDAAEGLSDPNSAYWETVDERLAAAGVSGNQVQAIWLKDAPRSFGLPFPESAGSDLDHLAGGAFLARERFPAAALLYLSSRVFGGYAHWNEVAEPMAFEGAFSVQQLIAAQIDGLDLLNPDPAQGEVMVPWMGWGPYLWADGTTGRLDGLSWTRDDYTPDGTHLSKFGTHKVALRLREFFKTDATARTWFLAAPSPLCSAQAKVEVYGTGAPTLDEALPIIASPIPTVPGESPFRMSVSGAPPSAYGFLLYGSEAIEDGLWSLGEGSLLVDPSGYELFSAEDDGTLTLDLGTVGSSQALCGVEYFAQVVFVDFDTPGGWRMSRGVHIQLGH